MRMILRFFRALATLFVFLILLFVGAAIFLPGMEDYKETANLTKVNSHYREAIRLARTTYLKGHTQYLKGHTREASVPEDAAGWILVFNPGRNLAPGGGNAYLADDVDGDATTGAIGIVSTSAESVLIAKPAFNGLTAETTIVTLASVIGNLPLVKPENTDM